ncbi:FAD/NAD(P)-binding domain-containing protein [Stipitochalara longipes BDJ]|nr:FAD/NAD(P)-binding domain-containing protein [Stipitochalara longipes BDJ]
MHSLRRSFLGAALIFGCNLPVLNASPIINERDNFSAADTITVDVCIVGGGSTGTYSAVRLSQDLGKSVIVIEKADVLGGHTNTFIDPVTNTPIDYGVQAFHNLSVVTNYFARFDIPLTPVPLTIPFTSQYVDFTTGEVVKGYSPPDPTAALETFALQALKYPYLSAGYELPDPVPADLLLPVGDFVTKYGIQDAVSTILTFAHGIGDLLASPTLYVLQNFGLPELESLATASYLTTARHDNSELYQKAAALLGSSVLYGSTLVHAERHDNGTHHITVQTPSGLKLIKAKKLLMTIPPILENLTPFELDHQEHSVFSQWQYTTYFTGIIRNGIPANVTMVNTAANTPFNLPALPYVLHFSYSGVDNLHVFVTISTSPQTQVQAENLVYGDIALMQKSRLVSPCKPAQIVAINNHTPIQMRVPAEAVSEGFYADLYALQGMHGTYWTGAAWAPDDSSLLWEFTEGILSVLVKALE